MSRIVIQDLSPIELTDLSLEETAAINGGGFLGRLIGGIVGGVIGFFVAGPAGIFSGISAGGLLGDAIEELL
jgi:hypothetical protein